MYDIELDIYHSLQDAAESSDIVEREEIEKKEQRAINAHFVIQNICNFEGFCVNECAELIEKDSDIVINTINEWMQKDEKEKLTKSQVIMILNQL